MEAPRRSERLRLKKDRISDLPNAILLYIMSFMMIKDVVKTSILSKRWKNLWKSLADLKLHTHEFGKPWFFSDGVSAIVSSRSRSGNYPLRTLDFNRHGYFQSQIFTDLINHVVSCGIQQLNMVVPYNVGLPRCVFSCHSLTSLYISVSTYDIKRRTRLPRHLDLPALRSLHLADIAISTNRNGRSEPFSTCHKLKNLYMDNCDLIYPSSLSTKVEGVLNITNATLVSLAIDDTAALSYKNWIAIPKYKYVIATPRLHSFVVNGSPFQAPTIPTWLKIELQSSSLT